MEILSRGKYSARLAQTKAEVQASQRLRALAFIGAEGADFDEYDALSDQILITNTETDTLVASYRLRYLECGERIGQSYSAQYYDLASLTGFDAPMLELGRFCTHPDHNDPDIVRVAWGAMARIVDGRGVKILFGCTSFQGRDAKAYQQAFALLHARHLAPEHYRIGVKAPETVSLDVKARLTPNALRQIPPLLRTYLVMGGWVSDHAVVDRAMNTLHVFTGMEIDAIPDGRKRLLRAVAGQ